MKVTYLSIYPRSERIGLVIEARDMEDGDVGQVHPRGDAFYKREGDLFYWKAEENKPWDGTRHIDVVRSERINLSVKIRIVE